MPKCDVAVIGSGPGGYVAALRAAQLGKKTRVVERDKLGGVCLHRGCIPTKALAHAAEVCALARHADKLGIQVGEVSVDFARMQANKNAVVAARLGLAAGALLFCTDNPTLPSEIDHRYGGLADGRVCRAFEAGLKAAVSVLSTTGG